MSNNPPLPFPVLTSLQIRSERALNRSLGNRGMDMLLNETSEDEQEETKDNNQGLPHTSGTDVPVYEENTTTKENTNTINNLLLNSQGGGSAQNLFSPTNTHKHTSNSLFG